jgi:hypothetical protein
MTRENQLSFREIKHLAQTRKLITQVDPNWNNTNYTSQAHAQRYVWKYMGFDGLTAEEVLECWCIKYQWEILLIHEHPYVIKHAYLKHPTAKTHMLVHLERW